MSSVVYNNNGIEQQQDKLTENSVIVEENKWENSVYEIDEQNYVHGGLHGFDNVPHEQLANRTSYLKSTCEAIIKDLEEFKKAVAEQNTVNANDLSAIRTVIRTLQDDLTALTNKVDTRDEKVSSLMEQLRTDVDKLISDMVTHTHKYAGSDTPGGDANTLKVINDDISKILLVGIDDSNKNVPKNNSLIYMQNNEITANKFHGNLDGSATSANHFTDKVMISFYGDVIASYLFDGSQSSMQVKTSLMNNGVTAGTYGPDSDAKLEMSQDIVIPEVTVNEKGLITNVKNRTYTLPEEAVSGTTNATQSTNKLYLVGAMNQKPREYTYTNNFAYVNNGILYSNNSQVVNLIDVQSLKNKTYEGYTLKEACSHGVDFAVQGTDGSKDLVTSNALYNHQHKYAGSDTFGGKANSVKVTLNDVDKRYVVINDNSNNGSLEYNDKVYVEGADLVSPVIHATNMLHIPGGKLWIDTSVAAVDGSSFNPETLKQIAKMQEDLNFLKQYQSNNVVIHNGTMADGVSCVAGDLIYYSKGGYGLADNSDMSKCDNVCLAIKNSQSDNTVTMIACGEYELNDASHDGENCYIGKNGKVQFGEIATSNTYRKKIGFVDGTKIIFTPNQYAVYVK